MVDYNNENTMAKPSTDINRVQILERRAYVIESLEIYYKYKSSGVATHDLVFRRKLMSLFWEIQETLSRQLHKKKEDGDKKKEEVSYTYDYIKEKLLDTKTDIEILIKIWDVINMTLGKINLTKIDLHNQPKTPRERALKYNNEKEGMPSYSGS